MRTLKASEWAQLYQVWRVPYAHLPKEDRARVVRGCAKKVLYDSRQEALSVADNLPLRRGMVPSVYPCDICKSFHIGNTRRRLAGQMNGVPFAGR